MAAYGRGPQPARPGPAWRPGTRPPVTRKPLGGQQNVNRADSCLNFPYANLQHRVSHQNLRTHYALPEP